MSEPIVLTVAEVATLLDCSGDTVALRAQRGELPGIQFGRSWVFPVRALDAVLNNAALSAMNSRQVTGQSDAPRRPVIPVEGSEFGPRRATPPALSVVAKDPA